MPGEVQILRFEESDNLLIHERVVGQACTNLIMHILRVLLAIVLLGTSVFAGESASAPTSSAKALQPDVYLITIDTLRADHVHCYGDANIQTPVLDALAADGVRFTHAFTPSPITNTSHTTILTGLLPSHHGVTDFAIPLSASHPTWAELIKAKGYQTAGFIGAVILDSKTLAPGLDRGFDYYDNFPEHADPKSRWDRVERRGGEVVEHAEKWMNEHPTGAEFVWVHLYDPHDPYEPPEPFSTTYKDRLYDGEVAYADSVLGNFVSYLKQHGRYENALIIVVGDHGEGLGEHGEETHGIFLYDSTTHVPLIVKMPRTDEAAKKGSVVDAQVRTTDLLPTVVDVLGIAVPASLDGESLPRLMNGGGPSRTAFGETDYPLRFGWAPLRSVRAGGFKFIEAPRPEMYDLKADPGESKNIYAAGEAAEKYRKQIADVDLGLSGDAKAEMQLPDPKDKIREQNLLHHAMMASDDNRTGDARAALEKVLAMDAKSATALVQLGELELDAGNFAKAAEYLGRARAVRPEDATAAYYQGEALEKAGDLAGARDALETSLKLTPSQLPARVLLGNVYLGLKDAKAAQDQFEAALLVDDKSIDGHLGLAKAMMAAGAAKDAVEELEPLVKAHPENAAARELLSEAQAAVGKK
jgi:arylsulfatase A-like enzyme/thioredoxin-like negative regulator of GroEL